MKSNKPISEKEIRRRLISRYGFTEDELAKLFPTEADVRNLYEVELKKLNNSEEEGDKWAKANYGLPQEIEAEFDKSEKAREALEEARKKHAKELEEEAKKQGIPVQRVSQTPNEDDANIPAAELGSDGDESLSTLMQEAEEELKRMMESPSEEDWDEDIPNN